MERNTLKLAAYLDEAGENPEIGCKTLAANNIHYIILRHCWTGNICEIPDSGHQKLSKLTNDHDLTVICIASELGKVDADQLYKISDEQIDRVISICTYHKAPWIRIHVGQKANGDHDEAIDEWMNRVTDKCVAADIVPLLEITPESHIYKAPDVAKLLSNHKRWKLLYDPVQFILRQNQDPFVRYWTLLKNSVEAIDVRDMKIGKGFKPAGFGDSKIDMTIQDALGSNYKGWFFMEPSLGRRTTHAKSKADTFQFALEGLDAILYNSKQI